MATPLDIITGTLLQRAFQPVAGIQIGPIPTGSRSDVSGVSSEAGTRQTVPDVFDRPQTQQVVQFPQTQGYQQQPQQQQQAPAAPQVPTIDPQAIQQAMLLQALIGQGAGGFFQGALNAFGVPYANQQSYPSANNILGPGAVPSVGDLGQQILSQLNPTIAALPEIQSLFTPNTGTPFAGPAIQPNQGDLGAALQAISRIFGGGG